MPTISQLSTSDMVALERRVQLAVHAATSLEAAAQTYAEQVYATLADSLVLVRVFATVRFADLPQPNREFAQALAATAGVASVSDETLVLSLLGTMGVEPAWRDRRQSVGHVGIPLLSAEFIGAIPMIARMLKQLGVELDWISRDDTAIVGKTFGFQSGVFYVSDASRAVDAHGRKIIAAQQFVADHGIETVFGVGGGYVGTPVFATIIGFCRDRIDEPRVERLRSHIDRFKAETNALVKAGKIFARAGNLP
jgi:hypothetical protein